MSTYERYGHSVVRKMEPLAAEVKDASRTFDWLHDQRSLIDTAVPGMAYLWGLRRAGTHLVPLGVSSAAVESEAWVRNISSQSPDVTWFHVRCRADGPTLTGIESRRAIDLIPAEAGKIVRVNHLNSNGLSKTDVLEFSRVGGDQDFIGVALVEVDRGVEVRVDASLRLGTALPLEAVMCSLEVEGAARKKAETLWWRRGAWSINGADWDVLRISVVGNAVEVRQEMSNARHAFLKAATA